MLVAGVLKAVACGAGLACWPAGMYLILSVPAAWGCRPVPVLGMYMVILVAGT